MNSLCLVGDKVIARSVRLNNLAGARFHMAIEDLRDMIEPTNMLIEKLTAPEPEGPDVFSGMDFAEIQIAADRMLSGHADMSRIDKLLLLIANLAARMKERA